MSLRRTGLGPRGGLGIKLAQSEKLVVATLGDGADMFANPTACHWTAQMYDLPVLRVIFKKTTEAVTVERRQALMNVLIA